jgi:glycine betaine/proline transport system substrate-binding protein
MSISLKNYLVIVISLFSLPVFAFAQSVRLGQVALSFYAVTGGIVQHVLESEGYKVEVIEGSHADIYPKVGTGEVDILAASWLPNAHAELYSKVAADVFKLCKLYDQAKLYWAVPSYIPSSEVSTVSDLLKPEVMTRMPTTIVTLPESTGLTILSRKVLQSYGLDTAGYRLTPTTPKAWYGNFKSHYDEKKWLIFPLWQPQWINAAYELRVLQEPKQIFGEDSAYLIANNRLKGKISPKAIKHLGNIQLSVADITEMDLIMNVHNLTAREAAERWIASHQDQVEKWKSQ